ncbi:hypothetical protein FGG78_34415 [Thioclava sp. BHET1]|nr:hypothetical protein FGG78_34415 [Thioclava sp. BHET1]
MRFSYSPDMQTNFSQRATAVIALRAVDAVADATPAIAAFQREASARLSGATEADFPEIKAWRAAYATMGLKPTKYRCAAEALLRRFRKEGSLPAIHPLIDLCNAASLAFATPVAVFDLDRITGDLTVRAAEGDETYLAFSGEAEQPEAGEVIFADDAGQAHARRWASRQSRLSAVSPATRRALIVAEALHDGAAHDLRQLADALTAALPVLATVTQNSVLDRTDTIFELASGKET